jgi:hypothetical protein
MRDVLRCHDSNRAALLNVAKALSQKLGPKGIRINRRRDLRRRVEGPVFVLTHHPDDAPETESVTFQGSDAAEAVRIELQVWNPGQAPAVARRISATRSGCSRAAKCPVSSSAIEWASGSSARLASRSGARDQS